MVSSVNKSWRQGRIHGGGGKWGDRLPPYGRGGNRRRTQVAWVEAYVHTKWYLSASGRFGHNGHWPTNGGSAPLGEGELGPRLTQCSVGRDLSPRQVVS